MSDSALSRSMRGSVYNIAVSTVTVVLGFGRSVLLMRLLAPDQFGFVTLALFFVTFLTPFSSFGIDSALIQQRNPGKEAFSTHFVLCLVLAIAILALGLLVSPVLGRIYADQVVVVDVFLVLLVINVLTASFSTPGAVLRRDMRFGAIAFLNLLSSLAMTITAPLLEANRAEIDYILVTPNTAYLEAKLDQIMPQARIYTGDGFIIYALANQGD